MEDVVFGFLMVGVIVIAIVIAVAVPIIFTRWVFRINHTIDLLQKIDKKLLSNLSYPPLLLSKEEDTVGLLQDIYKILSDFQIDKTLSNLPFPKKEADSPNSANERVSKNPIIKIKCQSCGSSLTAPAKLAGQQSKCPKCKQPVMVQKS